MNDVIMYVRRAYLHWGISYGTWLIRPCAGPSADGLPHIIRQIYLLCIPDNLDGAFNDPDYCKCPTIPRLAALYLPAARFLILIESPPDQYAALALLLQTDVLL